MSTQPDKTNNYLPVTDKLLAEWKEILQDATGKYVSKISDWELAFSLDILGNIHKYGITVRMTEKQDTIVRKIEKKIYNDPSDE